MEGTTKTWFCGSGRCRFGSGASGAGARASRTVQREGLSTGVEDSASQTGTSRASRASRRGAGWEVAGSADRSIAPLAQIAI